MLRQLFTNVYAEQHHTKHQHTHHHPRLQNLLLQFPIHYLLYKTVVPLEIAKEQVSPYRIDDYAKDGAPGEGRLLCSFYHEPLRTGIKIDVNKFAISAHVALKLGRQALKSYLKITCEFRLHILSN